MTSCTEITEAIERKTKFIVEIKLENEKGRIEAITWLRKGREEKLCSNWMTELAEIIERG